MKQYLLRCGDTRVVAWLDKEVNMCDMIKLKDQKGIWIVCEKYQRDDQPAWWYQVASKH